MAKIVVEGDNSLENVEVHFDNLLLGEKDLEVEKHEFTPLTEFLAARFTNFPPYLISIGQIAKAATLIKGQDELEIFFLIILAGNERSLVVRTLEKNRAALSETFYQEMLCLALLSATPEERHSIMEHLITVPPDVRTPFCSFIIALFSDEPQEISFGCSIEQHAAFFLESLKAEQHDNVAKAFADCLRLFEEHNHPFLFEYLRSLLMRYDTIPVPLIEQFADLALKSKLTVSFSSIKMLEFLYYFRNNITEKFEKTVTDLAEATDSLFVLNAIAPLLYRYEKWHLLGKFYKLAARKTTGKHRIRYLELLADIYEHKLKMPDLATEIHKNIVEEDPESCSVSLSLVLSVYEENRQWEDLAHLYLYLAEREKEPRMAAYYLFRAGELYFRELGWPGEARLLLERSLSIHRSFEIIRLLSEIYLYLKDYDAYIRNLEKELTYATSIPEQIALHDKIADALITFKRAYGSAEEHLLRILELKPDRIETIKKLGKIYYTTRNWGKLTEINSREVMLSENTSDIVNLLYKNGVIYFKEMHDHERARESFLQILSIVPHHIPSLLYLERIYLQQKATAKIIDLYTDLLQSATADSKTKEFYLTRLAIIYREQGDVKKARDTFRLVEYLYPDSTVAKENLRLLAGDVEFQEFTLDDFDNSEISSLIAASGNDRHVMARLENGEPSFYKYLWEKRFFGDSSVPDEALAPAELNLRTVLEGRERIDLLARHATQPAMLALLAQHYLEKGYFKGIYTILTHYLALSPTTKSAFWSIFFMGTNHPELKEKLNSLLVTDKEIEHFEVALSILEKIYLREKDYRTVLFLRTLFVKKLRDRALQRRFLDETISLLKNFLNPSDLLDLYKERYHLSEGADRDTFLISYRDLLASLGMYETLTNIYEEAWRAKGILADGMYLLDLFISRHEVEKAIALSHEILTRHPTAADVLDRLVKFFEATHRHQQACEILRDYLTTAKSTTVRKEAFTRLLRFYLESGNSAEAVTLFHAAPFDDKNEHFSRGIEVAERLLALNQQAFAFQIIQTLPSSSPEEALRKVILTLRCGSHPASEDIARIPSYLCLHPFIKNIHNQEGEIEVLRHFASRHDPDAVVWLVRRLLEKNNREEARRIINETAPFLQNKQDILHALALRTEDRIYEEKDILCQKMLTELQRGEIYPAERLLELISPSNQRARFFIQNLLAFLRINHTKPAENEWHYLSVIREDLVLAQAGFTNIDQKLRRIGYLLAAGIPSTEPGSRRVVPLTSAVSRSLFSLIEKISLATHAETLRAFWDEMAPEPLTIEYIKTPVLLFGPRAEKVDAKNLAFLTALHYFLITSGATQHFAHKSIETLVGRLTQIISLPSKERDTLLRTMQKRNREEAATLLEELKTVTPPMVTTFAERLLLAALLYAFTIIPDIAQVGIVANETPEHLDIPDSAVANAYALATATFFE